jgi:hypothetical protein
MHETKKDRVNSIINHHENEILIDGNFQNEFFYSQNNIYFLEFVRIVRVQSNERTKLNNYFGHFTLSGTGAS